MSRFIKLLLCLLCACHTAQAAEPDPRFNIAITFETEVTPPLQDQVEQALPILWQRIVTQQAQPDVKINNAMSLLQRVHPQADGSNIEFNKARVWAYLEKHHIAHIRTQPQFNLHISLENAYENRMPGSESELLKYSQTQAGALGIQLQSNAPLLAIHMQWLDNTQVQLSVRGQSRLNEFSETRQLDMGDPLVQLKAWVIQVLTRARDAYVWQPQTVPATNIASPNTSLQKVLLIEQQATLAEQVALETALLSDPRVTALTPRYLNRLTRQYLIQFKQQDDSWLVDWFAQRGMTATSNEEGWLIQ